MTYYPILPIGESQPQRFLQHRDRAVTYGLSCLLNMGFPLLHSPLPHFW